MEKEPYQTLYEGVGVALFIVFKRT